MVYLHVTRASATSAHSPRDTVLGIYLSNFLFHTYTWTNTMKDAQRQHNREFNHQTPRGQNKHDMIGYGVVGLLEWGSPCESALFLY